MTASDVCDASSGGQLLPDAVKRWNPVFVYVSLITGSEKPLRSAKKAYPLANASNPGAGRYIDAFPKTWDTLPKYDLSYFEDLSTVVNEEPVQEKDLVMIGMLPSLGIRKGQPFKPDAETAETLEQAVNTTPSGRFTCSPRPLRVLSL